MDDTMDNKSDELNTKEEFERALAGWPTLVDTPRVPRLGPPALFTIRQSLLAHRYSQTMPSDRYNVANRTRANLFKTKDRGPF